VNKTISVEEALRIYPTLNRELLEVTAERFLGRTLQQGELDSVMHFEEQKTKYNSVLRIVIKRAAAMEVFPDEPPPLS